MLGGMFWVGQENTPIRDEKVFTKFSLSEWATLIMISARSGADFFFLPDFMKISDDREY